MRHQLEKQHAEASMALIAMQANVRPAASFAELFRLLMLCMLNMQLREREASALTEQQAARVHIASLQARIQDLMLCKEQLDALQVLFT